MSVGGSQERRRKKWYVLAGLILLGAAWFFGVNYRSWNAIDARTRPAVLLNAQNFPVALSPIWKTDVGQRVFALAALGGRPSVDPQVLAVGDRSVVVLGKDGRVLGDFSHGIENIAQVADMFLVPPDGAEHIRAVFSVRHTRGRQRLNDSLVVVDSSGTLVWTKDSPSEIRGVALVGPRVASKFLVAVAYSKPDRLCLFDHSGNRHWCAPQSSPPNFVAGFDCDRDGTEEIAIVPRSEQEVRCFSLAGAPTKGLRVPTEADGLHLVDVDGDEREELFSVRESPIGMDRMSLTLGLKLLFKKNLSTEDFRNEWKPSDLQRIVEVALREFDRAPFAMRVNIGQVRQRTGISLVGATLRPQERDLVVALPVGWVIGTSLSGRRWGLPLTDWPGPLPLAAADLDGDGRDELFVAQGSEISGWSWAGERAPAVEQTEIGKVLEEMRLTDVENPAQRYRLGMLLLKAERYEEASDQLRKATGVKGASEAYERAKEGRRKTTVNDDEPSVAQAAAGDRFDEHVRRVIFAQSERIRACFEAEPEAKSLNVGRVTVKIVIAPSGIVRSAAVERPNVAGPALEQCVQRQVSSWDFGKRDDEQNLTVTYPFVIKLQKERRK